MVMSLSDAASFSVYFDSGGWFIIKCYVAYFIYRASKYWTCDCERYESRLDRIEKMHRRRR